MVRNIRVLNSVAALAIVTALATVGGVAISTERAAAQQTPPAAEIGRPDLLTLDEQLLEVAKQDPAFGGMFFNEEGRLTMYVQESVLESASGFERMAARAVPSLARSSDAGPIAPIGHAPSDSAPPVRTGDLDVVSPSMPPCT